MVSNAPPHNPSAERSVLGAMLLGGQEGKEAISRVIPLLEVGDMYVSEHGCVYAAIRSLYDQGKNADVVTVSEELRRTGDLERVGGAGFVAGLLDGLPLVSASEEHAKIIKDQSAYRQLMTVGYGTYEKAKEAEVGVEELLNDAGRNIMDIAQRRFSTGLVPLSSFVTIEAERIEKFTASGVPVNDFVLTGVPSGFPLLDYLTCGFQRGDLIIVAARPGMGKTSFVLNLAEHAAVVKKIPVLIFSLEMTAHSLVLRMLCSRARVDSQGLRRGNVYPVEKARLMKAAVDINEAPIWIDDSSRSNPIEIRAKIRRALGAKPPGSGLIIIDYLQELDAGGDGRRGSRMENRQQEISMISRSLKGIAKELNLPVVVASQLSRAPEKREGNKGKPRLSDLRESGAIEQDADVVMFLYREGANEEEGKNLGDVQGVRTNLSIAKQRNGPVGTFGIFFNKSFTRFDIISNHSISDIS